MPSCCCSSMSGYQLLCRDVLSRTELTLDMLSSSPHCHHSSDVPMHTGKNRFFSFPAQWASHKSSTFNFFYSIWSWWWWAPTALAGSACQEEALAASPCQLLGESSHDFPKQMEKWSVMSTGSRHSVRLLTPNLWGLISVLRLSSSEHQSHFIHLHFLPFLKANLKIIPKLLF